MVPWFKWKLRNFRNENTLTMFMILANNIKKIIRCLILCGPIGVIKNNPTLVEFKCISHLILVPMDFVTMVIGSKT